MSYEERKILKGISQRLDSLTQAIRAIPQDPGVLDRELRMAQLVVERWREQDMACLLCRRQWSTICGVWWHEPEGWAQSDLDRFADHIAGEVADAARGIRPGLNPQVSYSPLWLTRIILDEAIVRTRKVES